MGMGNIHDRRNVHPVPFMFYAKSFVQPKLPYAKFLIELGHFLFKFLCRLCLFQADAQLGYPVPYPVVKHIPIPSRTLIMFYNSKLWNL
jgi:hypothetical protein